MTWTTSAVILAGSALFILVNPLFKAAVTGRRPGSHLAGLGILALCAPLVTLLPSLALSVVTVVALVVVALLEGRLARSRTAASRAARSEVRSSGPLDSAYLTSIKVPLGLST